MANNWITVVFDLDGTLADCSHRLQYAQSKQWDEFHSRCNEDDVIIHVADLLVSLAATADIVILTGRPEKYRAATQKWLEESTIALFCDDLIMRPDDDWSSDGEMKIKALEKKFGSKEEVLNNVWLVLDDRDSVVEALRNYGLTVLQPAVGGY
jgi:FMN phosphatase YigB (HAD superfamily)